jgi:hypothetical protein
VTILGSISICNSYLARIPAAVVLRCCFHLVSPSSLFHNISSYFFTVPADDHLLLITLYFTFSIKGQNFSLALADFEGIMFCCRPWQNVPT